MSVIGYFVTNIFLLCLVLPTSPQLPHKFSFWLRFQLLSYQLAHRGSCLLNIVSVRMWSRGSSLLGSQTLPKSVNFATWTLTCKLSSLTCFTFNPAKENPVHFFWKSVTFLHLDFFSRQLHVSWWQLTAKAMVRSPWLWPDRQYSQRRLIWRTCQSVIIFYRRKTNCCNENTFVVFLRCIFVLMNYHVSSPVLHHYTNNTFIPIIPIIFIYVKQLNLIRLWKSSIFGHLWGNIRTHTHTHSLITPSLALSFCLNQTNLNLSENQLTTSAVY